MRSARQSSLAAAVLVVVAACGSASGGTPATDRSDIQSSATAAAAPGVAQGEFLPEQFSAQFNDRLAVSAEFDRIVVTALADAALSGPPPPMASIRAGSAGSAGSLALITSMMSVFEPVFCRSRTLQRVTSPIASRSEPRCPHRPDPSRSHWTRQPTLTRTCARMPAALPRVSSRSMPTWPPAGRR